MPSGRFSATGHISVRNSAMPKLTGTPMTSAMTDVASGAVDRCQRAELARNRVPYVRDKKRRPELLQCGQRRIAERNDDREQQPEHQRREQARHLPEQRVLPERGRRAVHRLAIGDVRRCAEGR